MKELKESRQMSENFWLGVFLAIVGGYLDAYTYVVRDGVFANAQTGNIVLLGINFASGNYSKIPHYLLPIVAFAFGVLCAEGIKLMFRESQIIHWRQLIILFEIVMLFVTAFIPQGRLDILVNIIISFVCALQVESFRFIGGISVATTMCTGNLRSGTENLFNAIKTHEKHYLIKALSYYVIIVFFIFGAIFGMFVTKQIAIKGTMVACLLLVVPFLMMFKQTKEN